jgi:hypothetical protein
MNISELRLKIDQNSQLSKDLQNQYRKLDNENRLLQSQLRSKEIEALSDYIEIGQSHTIFKFVSFSGVQTGGNTESLYFRENDVIEFILDQSEPHKYFEIILDAISSLLPQSTPNDANTQKLSKLAWLVDKQGNAIDPKSIMILHYPSLNKEIEGLLFLVPDRYISSSQLAKEFHNHNDCCQWLTEKVFITEDKALTEISKLLKRSPEYQIGEFSIEEFPLDKCLEVFKQFNVISFLPAWNFAKNLSKENFKKYLLPNLLDKMEVAKLRELLISLSSPALQVDAANVANVEIFNTYLGLAIDYGTFSTDILPHIHLLNRNFLSLFHSY